MKYFILFNGFIRLRFIFCRRSYTDVLRVIFEEKLLCSQDLFASEERYQKILELIPDESNELHLMKKLCQLNFVIRWYFFF